MDDIELPDTPASPESFNGLVDEKVLAPWGEAGPAPVDRWRQDVLGADYESRTIPLMDDDAGPVVATLVRYRGPASSARASSPAAPALSPAPTTSPTDTHSARSEATPQPPHFILLYIHGRNDYFFQSELAEDIDGCGGAFYALDLRRYGRSLRPGQRMGFVSNLSLYDEDISEALDLIREDYPDLPLVLMGHSTGGLLATLWANRHPGALDGLILNSAWLEMQTMASMRSAVAPILERIASRNPMWAVPGGDGPDHYGRSLREGWNALDAPLPDSLAAYPDDPAIKGWSYALEWKRPGSYPAYAAWLEAILDGHENVASSVHLDIPVLSMMSTSSYFGEEFSEAVFSSDVVLDREVILERSARLGPLVTMASFPGKHDLLLSDPQVRAEVYDTMNRWIGAFI
ncbi:alpha/beta hydrolase [Actinomyces sp. S6-Spd3]|uniref:alpha/beta fold hydrolase n=1 Tax=Actinomyces sp. S6-Spd3 TaxID=1284680 RepID=UPI00050F781C|nr:alpha/beta hydrolase [Actinomyces sp. S6-Spd3]KGF11889.1 alpha/beta hydrolase [Actinomyces sp. S6-Spd3]